jgi:geranylgeranyl diphosphate synthase, type II
MNVKAKTEELVQRLEECRRKIDALLDEWLPKEDEVPSLLHQAMRYSVLAGGKRLAPLFGH